MREIAILGSGWVRRALTCAWSVLVLGLLAAIGPAHADPGPAHRLPPKHRKVVASRRVRPPVPPQNLATLGRLVALAPRCNLRDPLWAQRLDVALNDAIAEAGADPMASQRALALTERQALDDIKKDGAELCRTLAGPAASTDLRKADELVK